MADQHTSLDDLAFSEGVDVEYKAARGGLPGDLWETYSAFANTEGGTLWLGITQRDGNLDIHGVPDPDKLRSDFWNLVNNRTKVSANLLREADVSVVARDDRRVIRIRVPRADRRTRPVYVGAHPFTGTFRRNFEGDYHCSEAEVRRMFADQSEESADGRLLEHFGLADLHADSLRRFRQLVTTAKPHITWVTEDDKTLLTKLGGWRRDRPTGKEGLTLAGLLMFGKIDAIRDHHALPGFNLDYRERFEPDTATRWTDRLSSDGTWEANLFEFYRQVMQKLAIGPGIKIPFRRDDEGTRLYATPVHEALQEALVNALIHGDHSGQGGVVIDRHPDRILISNPGTLLVSREQLQAGGVSECRNKSLQLMFQMLGAGDKAGSGIDKIRAAWSGQHWQTPALTETHRPDRVLLTLPLVSILPEATLAALRARFGPRFETLGPDEIHTLVIAELDARVTNGALQGVLTRHPVDISAMLGDLVRRGFLATTGTGRGTRYLPVAAPLSPQVAPLAPEVAPLAPALNPELLPLAPALNPELLPLTPALSPETNVPHSAVELLAILTPIRSMARAEPELMRAVILRLCARGFLPLGRLAALTGREPAKLRRQHLTPLVRDGRLRLRFPETPNHPEQAYTAAETPSPEIPSR